MSGQSELSPSLEGASREQLVSLLTKSISKNKALKQAHHELQAQLATREQEYADLQTSVESGMFIYCTFLPCTCIPLSHYYFTSSQIKSAFQNLSA
jgi:hypothetical protein